MGQVNGGAAGTPTAAPPGDARRPVGVVVASIVEGTRLLARKHVELAKIEAGEAVAVRGKGAGLISTSGVIGFIAIVFVSLSASAALDIVVPTWAAYLIVAGILGVIGWVLVVAGRRTIRTAPTPELSREALKEDARWAKRQLAR